MDKTTCTIAQKRFLQGRQTLTIDGNSLRAEYRRGLSIHEFRIDLRSLTPDPVRMKRVPVEKIAVDAFLCICGLGLSCVAVVLAAIGERTPAIVFGILGVPLLTLAILASISTLREWINVVIFQGPGGRVVLWPDLPSKEEFKEFCALLTARIQDVQNREEIVLRQVRQAGIIDDWQYAQAVELFQRDHDSVDE
jgi:hypothetical protein